MARAAPAPVDPADRFGRSPAVVARELEGETVVMRTAGSLADLRSLHVLNPMGTRIWTRLDGTTPLQAIVDELDGEITRADAFELIAALLAADLIERHSRLA
jgi:hypothetical protein